MRLGVVILAVLAGSCHGGATDVGPARPAGVHCARVTLAPGHAWRTRSAKSGGLRIAEATTARFHESAGAFPDATLRGLPPNGILIAVWDYGRERRRDLGRPRRLPYRLAEFRHDRGWEGQPADNVPQYLLFTSLRDHALDVRVFFGRQDPGRGVIHRAQTELASLRWGLCSERRGQSPHGTRDASATVSPRGLSPLLAGHELVLGLLAAQRDEAARDAPRVVVAAGVHA